MPTEATACRVIDVPAAQYHADEVGYEGPALSASIASTLIRKSPFHAYLAHPKLGGQRDEPSDEMRRGTVIHALLLGTAGEYAIIDAENFRTKAAQEQRDAAFVAGQTPILRRELDSYRLVAETIRVQLRDRHGIELTGESERVYLWTEPTKFGPVRCRGRLDHVLFAEDAAAIIDVKTCRSAHPQSCERHVTDYGYDIQRAAYLSAVEKRRPDLAGRIEYLWVFAEELPGYNVALTVAEASGEVRELGERRWARACETWWKCLNEGGWPGYAEGRVRLEAPPWELKSEGMV